MGQATYIPFVKQARIVISQPINIYKIIMKPMSMHQYKNGFMSAEHPESKLKPIDTTYFGGGTPTGIIINTTKLQMIVDKIKKYF